MAEKQLICRASYALWQYWYIYIQSISMEFHRLCLCAFAHGGLRKSGCITVGGGNSEKVTLE